jgi:UDP-glucose 4-epimerase
MAAEPKRAWVTGATSFLGRHVARQLARDGVQVIGFSRRPLSAEDARSWGFSAIEVDEFGTRLLNAGLSRFGRPAVVFHAIGSGSVGEAASDPAADIERTVNSTRILLDVLARAAPGARLIYPSSAAVYGNASVGTISEQAPASPISDYGKAKLLTEELCRAHATHLEIVIARLFSVFGPTQRKLLIWELSRQLLSGQGLVKLGGTGRETRDFVYVSDAAAMLACLAQLPDVSGTFNVGTGVGTSISELAAMLSSALDAKSEVRFSGQSRPGDPMHLQANPHRLIEVTGLAFSPLERGLTDYAKWVRQDAAGSHRAADARATR